MNSGHSDKQENGFSPPPRPITREFISYAKKRSKTGVENAPLLYILLIIPGMFAVVLDVMLIPDFIFHFYSEVPWQPYVMMVVSNLLTAIMLVILGIRKMCTYKAYLFVLANGEIETAFVNQMGNNWHVQVNNEPQTSIDMTVGKTSFRINTFSPEILDYCRTNSGLAILWHPDYPQIIIPLEGINKPCRKEKIKQYTV